MRTTSSWPYTGSPLGDMNELLNDSASSIKYAYDVRRGASLRLSARYTADDVMSEAGLFRRPDAGGPGGGAGAEDAEAAGFLWAQGDIGLNSRTPATAETKTRGVIATASLPSIPQHDWVPLLPPGQPIGIIASFVVIFLLMGVDRATTELTNTESV